MGEESCCCCSIKVSVIVVTVLQIIECAFLIGWAVLVNTISFFGKKDMTWTIIQSAALIGCVGGSAVCAIVALIQKRAPFMTAAIVLNIANCFIYTALTFNNLRNSNVRPDDPKYEPPSIISTIFFTCLYCFIIWIFNVVFHIVFRKAHTTLMRQDYTRPMTS